MKHSILFLPILFILSFQFQLLAQEDHMSKDLNEIFIERGEVYFKFSISDKSELSDLTNIISIDNVTGNEVFAYANRKEFEKFLSRGFSFSLLPAPSAILGESKMNMGVSTTDPNGRTQWSFYPTYPQYLNYMSGFASSYPGICKLDTIGMSVKGKPILVVKISDSVQYNTTKPRFLYTSSIHGDELTGYVSMLHLIDYLLANYGTDPRITNMVNNAQIYINPLANPDGTYNGNDTVKYAKRYNAHNIDLNRNYKDPVMGDHPDGYAWQPETMAFMNFADSNHFVLSMNFHGGSEVFNFPWDCWDTSYNPHQPHADSTWFYFLGREYADTVHLYSPYGYLNDEVNGVTWGGVWYVIFGGRQDYMTYFQHGREVTLEISLVKTPPANQLLNFWNYNYRSFLNYIEQASYGINGQVTDSLTGQPLNAKVSIFGHDADNSFVYSQLPTGWYFRPIDAGTYNLSFSTSGYKLKTINNINVSRWGTTRLNVQLMPNINPVVDEITTDKLDLFPNPTTGLIKLHFLKAGKTVYAMKLSNILGQIVYSQQLSCDDKNIILDFTSFPKGVYFLILNDGNKLLQKKIILN